MKRGTTDLCFVVGIDKPHGKSSHDVVNEVRRIFGERRVGHTGTLDPLATGALAVCVGPATRLDQYLTSHNKTYQVRVSFGVATDTDDAEGTVIRTADVPRKVCDRGFAETFVGNLVGDHKQLPPAYSAIKRNGVKSYEAARAGNIIQIEPRDITIHSARLINLEVDFDAPVLYWDIEFCVSKGTYIRSIARDIGVMLDSAAHVAELRRINSGRLDIEDCVSLEDLRERKLDAIIDPVFLLGNRMAFVTDSQAADIKNGKSLPIECIKFFEAPSRYDDSDCGPLRGAQPVYEPLEQNELVSLVYNNTLVALYEYDARKLEVKPKCVFPLGVLRGKGI